MQGLAHKRHHYERIKKNRRSYYGGWASSSDRALGMAIKTPKICSCPMCGNPRRHFDEVTRQEKIADVRMREEIEEALDGGVTIIGIGAVC